jgi:pyruvate dehydrogenase kinase 2/3/4
MIYATKRSKTPDTSVKNITLYSKVLLSNSYVLRTYHSPMSQVICTARFHLPTSSHVGKVLTLSSSHICFELLKNSLRAVVERFGVDNEDQFPPIKVVVVEGSEDITIKISDEGGGIPRSAVPMIWT